MSGDQLSLFAAPQEPQEPTPRAPQAAAAGGPTIRPGQTPQEAQEASRAMNRLRWAGTTPEERSRIARRTASHRTYGPQDPDQPRCGCGAMTLARATARADRTGRGLGHRRGCPFYRRQRHPGKRKAE
jgi:hypothetical protein